MTDEEFLRRFPIGTKMRCVEDTYKGSSSWEGKEAIVSKPDTSHYEYREGAHINIICHESSAWKWYISAGQVRLFNGRRLEISMRNSASDYMAFELAEPKGANE